MNIFDYADYKIWVHDSLKRMPKAGRGQLKRIADHFGTSPTIVTQVFNGSRDLTPEQAILLGEYFGLVKVETQFLVLLVNYSRAGSHRYRENLKEQIEDLRRQAREISSRVQQNFTLTNEAKSVLYSNWYYLAIWSLTAISGFNDPETISARLNLSLKKTRDAIEFLLKYSLIVEDSTGQLKVGPTLVHLESNSPQIPRHHQNWRLQAFARYENQNAEDVSYTAAITLAASDVSKIREKILEFISANVGLIRESPSEKLYCLCLDWFEV